MGKHAPEEGYNPSLRALILQVVNNQIAGLEENGHPLISSIMDDPGYVKTTFE